MVKILCQSDKRLQRKQKTQEKEQSEIADPHQDFCVVFVYWCYVMKERHNWNCYFITAGSDDRVPRCPAFIEHLTLTHDVFHYYSIEFRMGLK